MPDAIGRVPTEEPSARRLFLMANHPTPLRSTMKNPIFPMIPSATRLAASLLLTALFTAASPAHAGLGEGLSAYDRAEDRKSVV